MVPVSDYVLCLQGAADKVVSDAVSMAMLLGSALGVAMYAAAPWVLERIAGPASAAVVAPALVYVRIRCDRLPLFGPSSSTGQQPLVWACSRRLLVASADRGLSAVPSRPDGRGLWSPAA